MVLAADRLDPVSPATCRTSSDQFIRARPGCSCVSDPSPFAGQSIVPGFDDHAPAAAPDDIAAAPDGEATFLDQAV